LASPIAPPGTDAGRIAYVTCSVLDEENGAQIRNFVGRHPDFSVEKPAEVANALGERAYMFSKAALVSGEGVLMTPRRTDTDGFFVSLLRALHDLCGPRSTDSRDGPRTVHGSPRQDSHRRFRLPGDAADCAPGREEKVYSEIVPYQKAAEAFRADEAHRRDPLRRAGLVLDKDAPLAPKELFELAFPCSASATASRRWRINWAARSRPGITASSAAPRCWSPRTRRCSRASGRRARAIRSG